MCRASTYLDEKNDRQTRLPDPLASEEETVRGFSHFRSTGAPGAGRPPGGSLRAPPG